MKVVSIVGARPQFIKADAVSRMLRTTPGTKEVLVHTGQHYDGNMSGVFFEELEISEPDYHLGIGSGRHGEQTGKMLIAIEEVMLKEEPDWVLVYGDTNSTLAGAVAAVQLHIPVAHVEAGLRSFNRRMPEEINRVLTDHASDLLFAPTETAVQNLIQEGIPEGRIHLVGDVMYDAALYYGKKAEQNNRILEQLNLKPKRYILITIHRAENTDDQVRLRAIMEGLEMVANEWPVIFPVHPRTRKAMQIYGLWEKAQSRLRIIDPVGYLDMVVLEKNARFIATDSGGMQKEAFFCRVPCITLREETEWVELVENGFNVLVRANKEKIVEAFKNSSIFNMDNQKIELYGGGRASEKIVRELLR
jgi:UDP-GlcNAc3NAcA epimerase